MWVRGLIIERNWSGCCCSGTEFRWEWSTYDTVCVWFRLSDVGSGIKTDCGWVRVNSRSIWWMIDSAWALWYCRCCDYSWGCGCVYWLWDWACVGCVWLLNIYCVSICPYNTHAAVNLSSVYRMRSYSIPINFQLTALILVLVLIFKINMIRNIYISLSDIIFNTIISLIKSFCFIFHSFMQLDKFLFIFTFFLNLINYIFYHSLLRSNSWSVILRSCKCSL